MNPKKESHIFRVAAIACLIALIAALAACGNASSSAQGDASGSSETSSPTTVKTVEWTPDADCSTCHKTEASSVSNSACTASLHSQLGCTECHADLAALETAHTSAMGPCTATELKSTTIDTAVVCLSCHKSYDDLAAETEGSTALTDTNGKTVNPHALPATDAHKAENIGCNDCHKMHSADAMSTTAKALCDSCHHADVFECNTCH